MYIEDEYTELKIELTKDIKKEIIAFANTKGGKIYIGIDGFQYFYFKVFPILFYTIVINIFNRYIKYFIKYNNIFFVWKCEPIFPFTYCITINIQ